MNDIPSPNAIFGVEKFRVSLLMMFCEGDSRLDINYSSFACTIGILQFTQNFVLVILVILPVLPSNLNVSPNYFPLLSTACVQIRQLPRHVHVFLWFPMFSCRKLTLCLYLSSTTKTNKNTSTAMYGQTSRYTRCSSVKERVQFQNVVRRFGTCIPVFSHCDPPRTKA